MLHDKEVANNDSCQDDEDLHESDIEVANHIKLREGVLSSLTNIVDGITSLAERLSIHDCSYVAIFAEILT